MKFSSLPSLVCGFTLVASSASWAEEGKAGLPQMDPAYYPGELFWLAISFGLLYLMMRYVALPSVTNTQKRRQDILSTDMSAAKDSATKADTVLADYEQALRKARADAQVQMTKITEEASKEASAQRAVLQQALNKRITEAEVAISAARQSALKEVQTVVDDLASVIVSKVT